MKTWKQDLNIGLTKAQVEESRRQNGPNTLEQEKRTSFLASFLQSFGDPIIKILLVALAINVLLFFRNFDWYEAIGICISILLATFVSTLSEYGSESAFRTLEEESARIRSRVRRAGGAEEIPIEEIVVGDLVLLQSGERIPADGILVSGSLRMDQSALNGESVEVKKSPAAGEPTENLAPEDPYSLFRGTVVCSGNGVMRVTQVGKATLYGSLARELQSETRNSPMKLRLEQLAGTLGKTGYIAAVAVALADLTHAFLIDNGFQWAVIAAQCRDFHLVVARILHALTLAITTVVVAVPEGLPMMITIVLSANMKQMMRRHVLVRKLVGIETSGSLNVLFTDKTGTLTQGKLTVSSFVTGDGTVHTDRKSLQKGPELWRLIELACAKNNESLVSKQGIIGGNATDRALMEYALPLSPKVSGAAIQSQIPFDSRYKFSAVTLTEPASLVLVKGAPERILPACRRWYAPDGSIRPLTGTSTLKSRLSSMTGDAMRVLALAVSEKQVSAEGSFENLILSGLVGIRDNIRSDAASAVRRVQKAGIQVVMVTGDNQETAAAIARECGILHGEETEWVLTSAEMARLSDWELKERLPSLRVVARAMPSDKSRLVRAAQDLGLVAGMTGDGVNDAPALKQADVGFAMGNGTEVAKSAGDIVILNNSFSSICEAVLYGRTIFKSIRKFIIFQLTMNLCAVSVSVLAPMIGIDTPITVVQMLWINIIMDTLAGLAFAGEPPLKEYMEEPPKQRDEPIINSYMKSQIGGTGTYTVVLCIAFLKLPFFINAFQGRDNPVYFMTAFFSVFIFAGILNSFSARTYRLNILENLKDNPPFFIIMLVVSLVQLLMIYFGGSVFRTVNLQLTDLFKILLIASTVLPADFIRKLYLKKRGRFRGV